MRKVLNDLFDYGYKIYQQDDEFKFSIDSVLLAEFIKIPKFDCKILDMCTGNAPIPLILCTKTKSKIIGVEIQENIFECAVDSVNYNKLDEQILLINDDVKNITNYYNVGSFDIVSCNPPFFKVGSESLVNLSDSKAKARHEITIDLIQVIKTAKYLLKNKGEFYLVHRPERLQEILLGLSNNNFAVKKIQFAYSSLDKKATIVLLRAVNNGKNGMHVEKPIDIHKHSSYKGIFEEE